MESWIKIFRKFKDWEWYGDINTSRLFLHLLLSVNYEDKKWRGKIIKRGSLITSIRHLSKDTGLSVQSVRTCLNFLKSTQEVTHRTTPQYTEVTVNKFSDYQQVTHLLTNNQQTTNKQLTTTKEVKNIRTTTVGLRYLNTWNQEFNKHYTSTKAIEGNLDKWLLAYKEEEVLRAITLIKGDSYWKGKDLSPEWLLRTKDNNGDVDRIGRMLNNKVKNSIPNI